MSEPARSDETAPLGLGDGYASPSPPDYADLVRRLVAYLRRNERDFACDELWCDADSRNLADAIEALQAELAEYRSAARKHIGDLTARVAKLEEERRRCEAVIETYIPLGDLPAALASLRSYIAALEAGKETK